MRSPLKHFPLWLLAAYQRVLSPDHGWLASRFPFGWCRFYPSCSAYGRQAIVRHGLRQGLLLTLWRLGRCHPWSRGGVDLVPETSGIQRRTQGTSRAAVGRLRGTVTRPMNWLD